MSQQNTSCSNKPLRLVIDIDKPISENSNHKIESESFLIVTNWDSDIKSIKALIRENYRKWYPERKPLHEDFYVIHSLTGASIHDDNLKMNEVFDDWGKGTFSPRIFVYNSKKRQREDSYEETIENKNLETPLKKLKKASPQSKSVDYKSVKQKIVKEKRNSLVALPKVASNKNSNEESEEAPTKSGRNRRKKRAQNKGAKANIEIREDERNIEDSPIKDKDVSKEINDKMDVENMDTSDNINNNESTDEDKTKNISTQVNDEKPQNIDENEATNKDIKNNESKYKTPDKSKNEKYKIEKPKLNGSEIKKENNSTKDSKPTSKSVKNTPKQTKSQPDNHINSTQNKEEIIDDDDSSSSDSEDSEKMSDILSLLNSSRKNQTKKSTPTPKFTPKSSMPQFNTSKDIFSTPIPQFSSKKK